EFHRDLHGIRIVTAYDHVAIDVGIAIEHVRRNVVECCRDGNAFGYKLSRLLCSRALPNANGAAGASADTCSQRNGGINQDAALTHCSLQLLEQRSLTFKWHGEHQQIA